MTLPVATTDTDITTTYHINDNLAELQPLFSGQVGQEVAVRVLQQLERHGQMVLLEDALIVVHDSKFVICNDSFAKSSKTAGLVNCDPLQVIQSRTPNVFDGYLNEEVYSLELIKYWFVKPGWSTSWMAPAKIAASTSRSEKTS